MLSFQALNLFIVQQALLGDDMPSTGASGAYLMAYEKMRKPVSRAQRWVNVVTGLSTAAIMLSIRPESRSNFCFFRFAASLN